MLAVADHLGQTLGVVRSMPVDEFYLWLEWLKLRNSKKTGTPSKKDRRSMR